MLEVAKNLFVGNELDCFYDVKDDWAVVHACKHPCHVKKVGYTGSLPATHPEYLISEDKEHLFLNMVDMQQPLMPKYTHPIMKRAIEFINENILTKKVLIHCNQGESRAPSIALVYMAKSGLIQNKNFQQAYKDFIVIYPFYQPGNGISSYLQTRWDEIMALT